MAAARDAMDALVTPAATVVVGDAWGPGALGRIFGGGGGAVRELQETSRAVVWTSVDRTRLFFAGAPEAVARAQAAVEAIVATPTGGGAAGGKGSARGGGGGAGGGAGQYGGRVGR